MRITLYSLTALEDFFMPPGKWGSTEVDLVCCYPL